MRRLHRSAQGVFDGLDDLVEIVDFGGGHGLTDRSEADAVFEMLISDAGVVSRAEEKVQRGLWRCRTGGRVSVL